MEANESLRKSGGIPLQGRAASQGMVFGDLVLNKVSIFITWGIRFQVFFFFFFFSGKCLKQGMVLGQG